MYSDVFILKDSEGNELVRKRMLGHVKEFLDGQDQSILKYPLFISSGVSGYKFEITKDTTSQDWQNFNKDCILACD